MRKYIIIGEAQLDIEMRDGHAAGSSVGATLLNAARVLAGEGHTVCFASEVGQDPVGELIVEHLRQAGVNTSMIDRFAGGATQVALHFPGSPTPLRYVDIPSDENFDMTWPRVEADDLVVFGEIPAISGRVAPQIRQFLEHARERKALVAYFPGLDAARVPQATRVMPQVFENLELADVVISTTDDISILFSTDGPGAAFRHHTSFYAPRLINIDPKSTKTSDITADGTRTADAMADLASTVAYTLLRL